MQLGQLLRCATAAAPPQHGDKQHGVCNTEIVDGYLRQHPAWSSVSEVIKQAWRLRQALQENRDCRSYLSGQVTPAVDATLAQCLLKLAASAQHSGNFTALLSLPACAESGNWVGFERVMVDAVTAAVHAAIRPAEGCHAHTSPLHSSEQNQQGKEPILLRSSGPIGAARPTDAANSWLTVLCQWDAAADSNGWYLFRSLEAAMQAAHPKQARPPTSIIQQLCSSKAAAGITTARGLTRALEMTIAARDAAGVKLLLQGTAAADLLTPFDVGRLLLRAFAYYNDPRGWPRCRLVDDWCNQQSGVFDILYGASLPRASCTLGAAIGSTPGAAFGFSTFAGQHPQLGSACKPHMSTADHAGVSDYMSFLAMYAS